MILGSPYTGRKAKGYLAKREDHRKWMMEQMTVADMLKGATGNVLDVAIGTGRFMMIYNTLGLEVTGIDVSTDMMQQITGKAELIECSANKIMFSDKKFNTVVCVRLLHLVNEKEMQQIVKELCRVAKDRIILTIQLREQYYEGHDTATHVDKKFRKLIDSLGWKISVEIRLTSAGWYVMQLGRRPK